MDVAFVAAGVLTLLTGAHAGEATWATAERPNPHVSYRTFAAACDTLRAIARRALGAWADSAQWTRRREPFTFRDRPKLNRSVKGDAFWTLEDRDSTVPCLRMRFESHTHGAPGTQAIGKALEAAGWVADAQYDADGPDGTVFALVCREALCEIEGHWDGGDATDTTYVPEPGEIVILRCVPRPAQDPRPARRD